ncbi:hypothetical protein BDZ89DRAFT_1081030 [Hymenopellis radicata]|nr:hypothetical protein BDZ89DRAFT_1081030 [Hymenopellis radicata]
MRELCINSCPNIRAGGFRPEDVVNRLLHDTEFESSTEQIFKTRIYVFNKHHLFKRVDGVVRFINTELKREGHAGHGLWNTAAVNHGNEDQSDGDSDAEESDWVDYFLP